MIWKTKPTIEILNSVGQKTITDFLNIKFTEVGDDYLVATMPVDETTIQPMRLLHGGASVVLAETMGSVGGVFCLDNRNTHSVVGVEINASHLNSAREGDLVTGIARPIKVGKRIQVWEIKIHRSDGRPICVSRLTVAVVERR